MYQKGKGDGQLQFSLGRGGLGPPFNYAILIDERCCLQTSRSTSLLSSLVIKNISKRYVPCDCRSREANGCIVSENARDLAAASCDVNPEIFYFRTVEKGAAGVGWPSSKLKRADSGPLTHSSGQRDGVRSSLLKGWINIGGPRVIILSQKILPCSTRRSHQPLICFWPEWGSGLPMCVVVLDTETMLR